MTALVVDPSAILGVAMDDEEADFAGAVLDEIRRGGAWAPSIFWYELRNVLVVNERRGRVSKEQTAAFLAAVEELPIEIPRLPGEAVLLDLARKFGLSVYDAAYVELAVQRAAPLATLDAKLRRAAEEAGVPPFTAR